MTPIKRVLVFVILCLVFAYAEYSFASSPQPQRKVMDTDSFLNMVEKEIVKRNQNMPKTEQLQIIRDKEQPNNLLLLTIQYKDEMWRGISKQKRIC